MLIQFAKDAIFKNCEIHCKLGAMDEGAKGVLFFHFYNCPAQISFTRVVDNAIVKMTIKRFVSILPQDEDGVNRLVSLFLHWKNEHFDRFDKKVLDILSVSPKRDEYLFLRSSTFLNNRESWERDGIDIAKDEIKKLYCDYSDRRRIADESLGKYYIINDNYDHKILANKFTHQLYDLRKTVEVSGFAGGEGFSLIPLMVKYEDAYETPIEERETWDGKL